MYSFFSGTFPWLSVAAVAVSIVLPTATAAQIAEPVRVKGGLLSDAAVR